MTVADAAIDGLPDRAGADGTWRQRLAALLAVAAVAEALAILSIGGMGDRRFLVDLSLTSLGFLANVLAFPMIGALIIQRRPATRVAWLMIALGVGLGFGLVTYAYGVVGLPRGLPLALASLVLSQLFFLPAIGGLTTSILLLYPTDRLPSPRWRLALLVSLVGIAAYLVGTLLRPGQPDPIAAPGIFNPLALPGALGEAMGTLADAGNVVGLGGLILALASLVSRYRRADAVVAAQIRWLALVAAVAVSSLGISLLPYGGPLNDLLFGLGITAIAAIPIAIGIAITRYRLYDIDRLINRALVYGALTAILAGVFTAGVGLAQRVFIAVTNQTSDAAIVGATLVVATLYAPLRKRLEAIVDRRFKFEEARFGGYRDELSRYLALTEPARALRRLAREAADELDAIGAAVIDVNGQLLATAGLWPTETAVRIALTGRGGAAALLVGPRIDGRPHRQDAIDTLAEVADLASEAIRPT